MDSESGLASVAETMLLPVELLAQIFRAACCMDTRFHLTLRLVSRLCRDIARPLKYCSLFVHGGEHLHFIVRQLRQYPANIPLVEHVAITDHCHQTRRDVPGHISKPWSHRQPNIQMQITARPEGSVHHDDEFGRDVKAFLDMVAPTLRTLYLAFYSPAPTTLPTYLEIFRPNNGRRYPKLEEIGYRGSNADNRPWNPLDMDPIGFIPAKTGRINFPELKRIWLSGGTQFSGEPMGAFLADIAMACPRLTHLRLHEEHSFTFATFHGFLDRFMRWHGVQLGVTESDTIMVLGAWDQRYNTDTVAVLQSNPLLGFPHLQRVIIDMRPQSRRRFDMLAPEYPKLLLAVAQRRREVVVNWCRNHCARQRAPLELLRATFESSVSGDPELWEPENKLFHEDLARAWQPMKVVLPIDQPRLSYRANLPLSSEAYGNRP